MSEVFLCKWWGGKCEWRFFFVQMLGTNLGKYECFWEEKLRWLNPRWWNSRWQNSRWLPSSFWLRMNEFESEELVWFRVRVEGEYFWESERRKQGVWIPQCRSWIQDESRWLSESKWITLSQNQSEESVFEWIWEKIIRCLNPRWWWLNPSWQNSRWLPSSISVRMNEWCFFVQMMGTNLGKYEWVWKEKLRWLNPRWLNSRYQNSIWLPSSSWVRMNEFESDWISLNQSQSGVRVSLSESERR